MLKTIKHTSKTNRKWLENYLGIKIVSGETQIQDLLIALAKKVEKLERKHETKN